MYNYCGKYRVSSCYLQEEQVDVARIPVIIGAGIWEE